MDVIALLILAVLRRLFPDHFPRLPAWWHARPDLPVGSAQALAAATRGEFGNAIAWMCRRRGIGPGHPDWPYLARTIVAFGGSVRGFRPGLPACGLQWWENPHIVPGTVGETAATPAADAMAALLSRAMTALSRQPAADTAIPDQKTVPARAERATSPAPLRPVLARTATGPPIGPPAVCGYRFVMPDARGRRTVSPAVVIRAGRKPSSNPTRRSHSIRSARRCAHVTAAGRAVAA